MQFSGRDNLASNSEHDVSFPAPQERELTLEIIPRQCYYGRSADIRWGFSSWGMRQASSSNPFPLAILDQAGLHMLMAFDNDRLFQGERSTRMDSYFPGFDPASQLPVLLLTGGDERQNQALRQLVSVHYHRESGVTHLQLKRDARNPEPLTAGDLPWALLLFNKDDLGPNPSFSVHAD